MVLTGFQVLMSQMCHCVLFGNGGLYLVLCTLFFVDV